MNTFALYVHTYPGGSDALLRHEPYFRKSGASRFIAVTTTDGECAVPKGWDSVAIGRNDYLNGDNLCRRLMDTIEFAITQPEHKFLIAEYDCLFFDHIRQFDGFCAHRAGGQTWGSRNSCFVHPPWAMDRDTAKKILKCGTELLATGFVKYGSAESSPDCFIAWVCETASIPMNHNAWTEFSRNSYDVGDDLTLARGAVRAGYTVVHGVKKSEELAYILT